MAYSFDQHDKWLKFKCMGLKRLTAIFFHTCFNKSAQSCQGMNFYLTMFFPLKIQLSHKIIVVT